MRKYFFVIMLLTSVLFTLTAQEPETLVEYLKKRKERKAQAKTEVAVPEKQNDSNTPLHLLKPDYEFNYGIQDAASVKMITDRILNYLDRVTPAIIENQETKEEISNYQNIDHNARIRKGDFRLTSYEWGVTYSGMLRLAEVTNDTRYGSYVTTRFNLLGKSAPFFKKVLDDTGNTDPLMKQMLKPHALDDAGAMCASMIKASLLNKNKELKPLIDNYINYILYHEYRLSDGTFARNRPQKNSVWLDDMYMSIPAIVYMGKLTGDSKYFDEAARQVILFKNRMWIPEMNLFRHGWIESMEVHPSFFWARANGWALLTLCEVLDVLPYEHPLYNEILDLLRSHLQGLAALQSGHGLWHQLLNRNDSYLETSASAIFVYGMAHAINKGWVDAKVFGPVASLGWAAIAQKVNTLGQVEGTCVGTGMGFDAAFYYYRPVSVFAAHGYGPVLLAGAEMIELSQRMHPKMNDSALLFYFEPQKTSSPIFVEQNWSNVPLVAGSTRKGNHPVVFIIGDSTGKTGGGKGETGQWGWGSFLECFFDTTRISIENHARGGRSSRTFYTEGLWEQVYNGLQKGDYLFVQFGHNDGGPLNTGRARASLSGTGNESETVIMERHGGPEEVFTFGRYLRYYIRQAKAKGVNVIVLSHTPGNWWNEGRVTRCDKTYGKWSQEVAQQEGVQYIDLNHLAALKYEALGPEATKDYFMDNVHTSAKGAVMHARCVVEGVLALNNHSLVNYIVPNALTKKINVAAKPLFRDPVYDGAADPVIIWNKGEQRWFMFYTNRRANIEAANGVEWVHGTHIGIAESVDAGATWQYRGIANIKYGNGDLTFWAPDVIEHNGVYHMYLTVVPGIFPNWQHPREIIHLTSQNLTDWEYQSKLPLATDKVIDASIIKAPNGKWRLYYNNERDGKTIWFAESSDLFTWTDMGKALAVRGEGPKLFFWKEKYFLMMDTWDGLALFSSDDMLNWVRQPNNILQKGGSGPDDQTNGLHADVVINNNRAYVFYFTHPGRKAEAAKEDNYETRRSTIQVAELEYINGEIVCNRDMPVFIDLKLEVK